MTAEIIYRGDLRTVAVHGPSGSFLETDAPTDNKGRGERFSPTDLVATALGSCMLTIMGIAARTHEIPLEGTRIGIQKIMVADPQRRIGEVVVNFTFPEGVSYDDRQKTILEKAALTCPVYLSLGEHVKKTVHFNWAS